MPADPTITEQLNELEKKVGDLPDGPVKHQLAAALAHVRVGHVTQVDLTHSAIPISGMRPTRAAMGDGVAACC